MANSPLNTEILDKAIIFAVKAHAGTERRGKGYPYVIHPMEAVTIVSALTSDQELLAAAALHDVVEDTDCTVEELRAEFGDRIAAIVDSESDNTLKSVNKSNTWRERKQAAAERLTYLPLESKIVAMGDKLSNMRTIADDYDRIGDEVWKRFHAPGGKADIAWRYRLLVGALAELQHTPSYEEFVRLVDHVFGHEQEWIPVPVNMDDFEESGDGYTAISYNHKDGHRMVKMYKEFMPPQVAIHELMNARSLVKLGLKTPLPLRFVTDGKRVGTEFQRINPKKSFARAMSENPDTIEKYALEFSRLAKQMHHTVCDKTLFPSMADNYKKEVMKCVDFSDAEKKRIIDYIDTIPVADTCVHGDMHVGNVITNGEDNWWIDLSDFSWGNPMFDIGIVYLTAKCNPDEFTQYLFHVNNEQYGRFWDIFAKDYFGIETPEQLAEIERQVAPFAALKMIFFANQDKMQPYMKKFISKTVLS